MRRGFVLSIPRQFSVKVDSRARRPINSLVKRKTPFPLPMYGFWKILKNKTVCKIL